MFIKKRKTQVPQSMDTPRYRFRDALYGAFYSARLYVDVATRWRGFAGLYLLLLLACVTLPISIRLAVVIDHYLTEQYINPIKLLPPLLIQNGNVSLGNEPQPYYIKNKDQDLVAIVDTTGVVNGLDAQRNPKLSFVITKNKIYMHPAPISFFRGLPHDSADDNQIEVHIIDPEINGLYVGHDLLESFHYQGVRIAFMCVFYPCFWAFFSAFLAVLILILAGFGQFYSRVILRTTLPYMASVRLMVVALTPGAVFLFGLMAANFIFAGVALYALLLLAIYYNFGVLMVKRRKSLVLR